MAIDFNALNSFAESRPDWGQSKGLEMPFILVAEDLQLQHGTDGDPQAQAGATLLFHIHVASW